MKTVISLSAKSLASKLDDAIAQIKSGKNHLQVAIQSGVINVGLDKGRTYLFDLRLDKKYSTVVGAFVAGESTLLKASNGATAVEKLKKLESKYKAKDTAFLKSWSDARKASIKLGLGLN